MKAAAGGVSFGTQKLSFSATLCAKRFFSTECAPSGSAHRDSEL
jgi:hypothetical protein